MKTINQSVDLSDLYFKALPEWLAEVRVTGFFYCSDNQLTSLKGSPKEVGGSFYCSDNQLTSLEGCPKEVGGSFNCYDNPGKFTEEDVRKVCNVKGGIYV